MTLAPRSLRPFAASTKNASSTTWDGTLQAKVLVDLARIGGALKSLDSQDPFGEAGPIKGDTMHKAIFIVLVMCFFGLISNSLPPSLTVIDYGISGSLTANGAIGFTNVQDYAKFGVESEVTCVGACPAYTGTLQGRNSNPAGPSGAWFNLPIKATGDATKTAALAASGSLFLEEGDLNVNFVRVLYTVPSGQLNIREIRKARKSLPLAQ